MTDAPNADQQTPGPLLGTGRSADVFDIGDGKVLRRYRSIGLDIEYEKEVMRHVARHGVRVPEVFDSAAGYLPDQDIIMERIDGITMLDDFEARPWKLFAHVRLLARLQREVNAVSAPEWMSAPTSASTPKRRDDSVLHLDLHPMNVMLSDDGPVIIDWTNAAAGPAGFDAALTYVMMSTFEVEGFAQRLGVRMGVEAFKRVRGAGEIEAFLVAACDHRLADPVITPGERVAVAAMRTKALGGREMS